MSGTRKIGFFLNKLSKEGPLEGQGPICLSSDETKEGPTIKISIFTYEDRSCGPFSSFFCCTHLASHSAAQVYHLPSSQSFIVGLGGERSQEQAKRSLSYSMENKTPFMKSAPTILAYENDQNTFENFKDEYPIRFSNCHPWNNCADATTFAIDYFPKVPEKEPKSRIFLRSSSKILCGFFGTCLGIRACDTFPTLVSPKEVEKRARQIKKDQNTFFSKGPPEQMTMEDHTDISQIYAPKV